MGSKIAADSPSFGSSIFLASMFFVAPVAPAAAQSSEFVHSNSLCRVGAYASAKGEAVALTLPARDHPTPLGFNYSFVDGRRGNTTDEASLIFCGRDAVHVKQADGTIETWNRMPLRYTRTRFQSQGHTLSGMLIEPAAAKAGKPPLAVLLHGSERRSSINYSSTQYMLAAQGISVFVFDKHGTGESAGQFHMNIQKLARDGVAASAEAKRLAGGRYSRFGIYGGSAAGWVAPLVVKDAGAEFMAIGFSGVFTPAEEDAAEVEIELRQLGYGDDVIAKARRITDATGSLMISNFTAGLGDLARLKKEYAKEPWLDKIEGEYTGALLKASDASLNARAGRPNNVGLDYGHDALETLRAAPLPPTLWVLAGADRDSPPSITLPRLKLLQNEGKRIKVVVFPDTDHGMEEFVQLANGSRRPTRVTEGYWRLMAGWIKGKLSPPYGRAIFEPEKL